MNKKGGYSCAMKNCNNISGRIPGLSFFSFPRDSKRAQLWLRICGRTIETSIDNLHKNYRVCANHFENSMFLNDLQNRLQPHAVPNSSLSDNNCNNLFLNFDNEVLFSGTQLINKEDQENQNNQMEYNKQNEETQEKQEKLPIQVEYDKQTEETQTGYNKRKEQEYDKQDEETQTDAQCTNNSPRKQKLKGRIHSLQKKVHKLKQQLKRQKDNIKKSISQCSIEEYCNITDQLLPPTIATFVKTQVQFSHKSVKANNFKK